MTPTPAQIEAAAMALADLSVQDWDNWELMAETALTAAAQVEDKEWEAVCDSYAKENGQFHTEIEKLKHDIARHIQIASDAITERDATIERCAQRLEQLISKGQAGEFGKLVLQDAADELRKLKEQS